MKQYLEFFATNESGAVTVDWVVLTAFAVTLLAAGYSLMESAATDTAGATTEYMTDWTF